MLSNDFLEELKMLFAIFPSLFVTAVCRDKIRVNCVTFDLDEILNTNDTGEYEPRMIRMQCDDLTTNELV